MVVIIETYTEAINPPSATTTITHDQLWNGLLYGIQHHHLFLPSFKSCTTLSHTDEEIVVSQVLGEHATLGHSPGEHRNTFKLSPPSKFDGTEKDTTDFHFIGIIGEGPGGEKDLYFTLVHEWNAEGIEKDSEEHKEARKNNFHPRDLARAYVENTRRMVEKGEL